MNESLNEFDTSLLNGRFAICRCCKSVVVSSTTLRHFRYLGPGSFFEMESGRAKPEDAFECGCKAVGHLEVVR